MFKVNNWRHSGVFNVNFEHVNADWVCSRKCADFIFVDNSFSAKIEMLFR